MIKEYWNLIGQEPFLAITWEPDFSQACSFPRILIKYKNFNFTQIPDKTNDVISLKSPKTDGRTDGRTLFYRTLPAEAGGPLSYSTAFVFSFAAPAKWLGRYRFIKFPKSTKTFMFINMQKINFIAHFFPEILRSHWKLVTLGTLGMTSHFHQHW